jgi:hypothetical protein
MILKSLMKSAALALILALATGSAAMAADPVKKHRVVFQLNTGEASWGMAMNNVMIMQKTLGKENVDIELVANGAGLGMLKIDTTEGPRLAEAIKNGITVYACGQTMKATKVSEKDLYPGVQVVPGGNLEVMYKQEAGWTYLKI